VPRFDYVTVGHVTLDVILDPPDGDPTPATPAAPGADTGSTGRPAPDEALIGGRRQPGGGAFYSALQAARLGLRTLIVTRGVPEEIERLLAPYAGELELRVQPASSTTTLQTRDAPGGVRRQRLLAWAGPMAPPGDVDAAILHLAPVARETPPDFTGGADLVGLTPQGLVRGWGADGEIAPAALARELLPRRLDAAVLSADELPACAELLPPTAGAIVAVTHGAEPTAVHVPGAPPLRVPVPAVADVGDDLGAGDVFAAAFFTALHEGVAPEEAARCANAAAAVRIAGAGPAAVGSREEVVARVAGAGRGGDEEARSGPA